MGTIDGYVTVYESTDGGRGDPRQTFWQFFVDPGRTPREAVNTKNPRHAETMRFAVETNSKVTVSYDDNSHEIAQVRIEFKYICESVMVQPCGPGPGVPQDICVTRRYTPCNP